jgi:hypothetical protein
MRRKLSAKEIEETNRIVNHCEALINARGLVGVDRDEEGVSRHIGIFDAAPWRVCWMREEDRFVLQIFHDGRDVFRCNWNTAVDDPGKMWAAPGAWKRELLNLPIAHA